LQLESRALEIALAELHAGLSPDGAILYVART
jgi:hypothetical protein